MNLRVYCVEWSGYGYMGEVELMSCSQKMIVAECCCMMCGCIIECWSSVDRISGSDGLMMEVPICVLCM